MLHVLLPALFAGLVAVLITVAIERFGGRVGGLLGTLPTTIVPSSIGMAWAEPEVFQQALSIAPGGMLLNALFLWLWRVLPDRVPNPSLAGAWTLGALTLVGSMGSLLDRGVRPEAIGVVATALIVIVGTLACLGHPPAPLGRRRVGPMTLVARGLLAGGAIAISLAIAHAGHGLIAGVASVFPAIFLTAMVSVWWSQGQAVSGGAVGPMMLGSAAVAAYAVVAAVVFPVVGPVIGALLAWGRVKKQGICLRRLGIPEDAASDLDVCQIQPAAFANALAAPKRRNSDPLFLDSPWAAAVMGVTLPAHRWLRR